MQLLASRYFYIGGFQLIPGQLRYTASESRLLLIGPYLYNNKGYGFKWNLGSIGLNKYRSESDPARRKTASFVAIRSEGVAEIDFTSLRGRMSRSPFGGVKRSSKLEGGAGP